MLTQNLYFLCSSIDRWNHPFKIKLIKESVSPNIERITCGNVCGNLFCGTCCHTVTLKSNIKSSPSHYSSYVLKQPFFSPENFYIMKKVTFYIGSSDCSSTASSDRDGGGFIYGRDNSSTTPPYLILLPSPFEMKPPTRIIDPNDFGHPPTYHVEFTEEEKLRLDGISDKKTKNKQIERTILVNSRRKLKNCLSSIQKWKQWKQSFKF